MSQQPDKLFRDKLANLQRPAPSEAWSKIEASMYKKKNSQLFLKIAAAILLLFAVTFSIWIILKSSRDSNTFISKNQSSEKTIEKKLLPQENAVSQKNAALSKQIAPADKIAAEKNVKKNSPVKITPEEGTNNRSVQAEPANKTPVTPQPADDPVAQVKTILPEVEEQPIQENHSGFKLVIESDYVNEKYFNKNEIADATVEDQKPSKIKKLLDKAYDLKNNQNPLGELRQMKNEILALNLQKDKKNNKTSN